jgi:hypothetical protein
VPRIVHEETKYARSATESVHNTEHGAEERKDELIAYSICKDGCNVSQHTCHDIDMNCVRLRCFAAVAEMGNDAWNESGCMIETAMQKNTMKAL